MSKEEKHNRINAIVEDIYILLEKHECDWVECIGLLDITKSNIIESYTRRKDESENL